MKRALSGGVTTEISIANVYKKPRLVFYHLIAYCIINFWFNQSGITVSSRV